MITELSILIPSYNGIVYPTVKQLVALCERIVLDAPSPFKYEIIVADDGSDQLDKVEANKSIDTLPHCRYIIKEQNRGSAATRNFLAKQSQYEWLLFIDCDMEIPGMDYIMRYLPCDRTDVTNGGIKAGASWDTHRHNLRYLYEKDAEPRHTIDKRQAADFKEFRSTNFLIRRSCIIAHPFDERFMKSGYEDVYLGKTLQEAGATILHIDNPLILNDFENNEDFIRKTERNITTLYRFRKELKGYSRLIDYTMPVSFIIRLWHRLFGQLERRNLTSNHPLLWIYTIYRFGFYCSQKD
ncbi:MAG: glycosyltransferase family 2 protein [Prevotella sp.]|nr:glycosyltransferase family 2 protein [Prevotella sp.]